MSTIQAKQILPFLVKAIDMAPEEDKPRVHTMESDGIEEYLIPKGEEWTLYGKQIVQVNLEQEDDEVIMYVYVTNDEEPHSFYPDDKIDVDLLKRYIPSPVQFELPAPQSVHPSCKEQFEAFYNHNQ